MPGENLSREEAHERAELLTVDGYEIALDLRSAVDGAEEGGAPAPSAPSPPSASVRRAPAPPPSPT